MMRFFTGLLCALALPVLALANPVAFESTAKNAILFDATTHTVLYAKKPDDRFYPASITKLMTALLVFERLKDGRLTMDDTFRVSETAWRKGGSRTFLDVNSEVRIEDLLRGMIIQSGNDASIVLAEGLAGTEEDFGTLMTSRARELGMKNTTFFNATGWPDERHMTTARDMAILASHLIQTYPEYYRFYSEPEFTYNNIRQYNRNPLLGNVEGADGFKTGYTEDAGYCLVGAAQRNGRRLVMVIAGLDTARARAAEARRIIEWGFREFDNFDLFSEGDLVAEAAVWLGESRKVPLLAMEDIVQTLPTRATRDLSVKVYYDSPLTAPVARGQQLGELRISSPSLANDIIFPLVAGQDVKKLGFFKQFEQKIHYLLFGEML